jgi:hypothetical protein
VLAPGTSLDPLGPTWTLPGPTWTLPGPTWTLPGSAWTLPGPTWTLPDPLGPSLPHFRVYAPYATPFLGKCAPLCAPYATPFSGANPISRMCVLRYPIFGLHPDTPILGMCALLPRFLDPLGPTWTLPVLRPTPDPPRTHPGSLGPTLDPLGSD